MSADETITGRPPRIPQHRLPGGRQSRHVLAAIEDIGNEEPEDGQSARKRELKSDFDVWKGGIREKKNESSFAAAAAVIDASSPASLTNTPPPRVYQYRNNSGMGRTKQIEALEEEYLNGGRRKVASPIAEETEEETQDMGEEVAATSKPPPDSLPLIGN